MYPLKFRWVFVLLFGFVDLLTTEKRQDIRDPFNLSIRRKAEKSINIKLLGIICSADRHGAILQVGKAVNTFFLKDKFNGVELLKIGPNYVVVSDGKNKKQLFLK
jgi:hypothetical protein